MRADHVFKVLDVHAGGNPARIFYSGLPRTSGATMMDKMREFQANHDWIRSAMVLEPHGGNNTSAVVLTDPVSPLAHVGAFFMEAHGYLPMCGSDTLALATALIESGQVAATGPETVVRIDTPAGLIEARAVVDGLKVTSVTFLSAPAFCLHHHVPLTLPTGPTLTVDEIGRAHV